jgi:hypothetical protein
MEKLSGWTNREYIPCDFCLPNGRKFICQASRCSYHTKHGKRHYCTACAAPIIKANPKKKKTPEERQKDREDYQYMQSRDWYYVSGASNYI